MPAAARRPNVETGLRDLEESLQIIIAGLSKRQEVWGDRLGGLMTKREHRKRRRTQVQRRNKTQAAILSASIKLLADKGYAGFSASRVAARAQVSRGAQEHYFPKKNDLIAASTRYAMREAVDHAQSLARDATRSKDPIEKFLMDSEHFFFGPVYRAMIEIMIAARSDRALGRIVYPIAQEARDVLNGIWIDTLDAAGYPRDNAQRFIELTHYLLRGLFLVSNWLPYRIERAEVIHVWRQLARTVLELIGPTKQKRRSSARPRKRPRSSVANVFTRSYPGKNMEHSL
jgi:AcrR family transcriptional regulator